MFSFTLKETGEEFILPTPDEKEVEIDVLIQNYKPKRFDNLKYFWWCFKRYPRKRQFKQLVTIFLLEVKCLFLAGRTTDEI